MCYVALSQARFLSELEKTVKTARNAVQLCRHVLALPVPLKVQRALSAGLVMAHEEGEDKERSFAKTHLVFRKGDFFKSDGYLLLEYTTTEGHSEEPVETLRVATGGTGTVGFLASTR